MTVSNNVENDITTALNDLVQVVPVIVGIVNDPANVGNDFSALFQLVEDAKAFIAQVKK